MYFIHICILLLNVFNCLDSAKILVIFSYPGPSQYNLVQPYLRELLKRGHEITAISTFPQKQPIKNFRDVPVVEIHKLYADFLESGALANLNKWSELCVFGEFSTQVHELIFANAEVKRLLFGNESFDLVITETGSNEPLYGIAQQFNASLIGITPYGTDRNIDELVGNISPLSYVPLFNIGYTEHMSFKQRLKNLAYATLEWLYLRIIYYPRQEQIFNRNFPNATQDMLSWRRQFDLVFVNQHLSFEQARPYVPNMIRVGGFHIPLQPKALPEDITKFITAHPAGIIYFSLGSNVQSKDMPAAQLKVLKETFASLPHGVIWKYETAMPEKPTNVYISKWLPQADILAQPQVKLLISHGGLLTNLEAIHYGKPFIGIPCFFDQFNNVKRAVESGYALRLDKNGLSVEQLKGTIERMLNDSKFAERAQELSKLYHDQLMTPMETAIYWTEYVLRNKGAKNLRVAGQKLNLLQLHSVDTIMVLYGGSILLLCIVFRVMFYVALISVRKLGNGRKLKLQ